MKLLIYTVPYMMNATYFIDIGYANAFRLLGHSVYLLEYGDPLPDPQQFIPDISISYFHIAYSEKTEYEKLTEYKKEHGTRVVVWGSPFDVPARKFTDEHCGLHPKRHLRLMEDELFDLCISFYPETGIEMYYKPWTDKFGIPVISLPFAADITVFTPCTPKKKYNSHLCFIGGIHRTKQEPFQEYIKPLLSKYGMIVAGKGWKDWRVQRMSVPYGEESKLISSASIMPNVHMALSREVCGLPPNMRTFQSIAGGGFVISDNVPALRDYFSEEEIPIGDTPKDYAEKIGYFMSRPRKRHEFRSRAYRRLINEHTYEHRVTSLLKALSFQDKSRVFLSKIKRINGLRGGVSKSAAQGSCGAAQ